MSSSEEESERPDPVPRHRIRFTDMTKEQCETIMKAALKAEEKHKLDKDASSELQKFLSVDPVTRDETAGWHVVVGKSFASAITYKTMNVCFFDLLENEHKTFLCFKTE